MLSKIAAPLLTVAASTVQGRGLQYKVRNNSPRVATDHPIVQVTSCGESVTRLKAGPVDYAAVITQAEYEASQGNVLKYLDKSFYGSEAVHNTQYYAESEYSGLEAKLEAGTMFWERWKMYYPNNQLMSWPDNGTDPQWSAANQGEAGDCYYISALAGVAEDPRLIKDMFLTDDNAAGIYGVRFFIRGKPWVVDIDDTLVFDEGYQAAPGLDAGLIFNKPFDSDGDLWASVLEKAWAKVKGDITLAGQGGYVSTGLRSLIGSPSFGYYPVAADVDTYYTMIGAADAAGYIMGAGTAGSGNDQESNSCGIAMSHAYTIITSFTMTDANAVAHEMLMIRNPWGSTNYSGTWAEGDANWTDPLVAQVPHGIDPRTSATDGIFVCDKVALAGDTGCFSDIAINHLRDDEGYTDDWIDAVDMDEANHVYKFTVPAEAVSDPGDAIYVSIEGYYAQVIPNQCILDDNGNQVSFPSLTYRVDNVTPSGAHNYGYVSSYDYTHSVVSIPAYDAGSPDDGGYTPGDDFSVEVQYDWENSPHKDYTVKVYSKWANAVMNNDDPANPAANQLFTDGTTTPTEFTGTSFDLGDMVDSWYLPPCVGCMACGYCTAAEGGCPSVSSTDGFAGYNTLLAAPTALEQAAWTFSLECDEGAEYLSFTGHANNIMDGDYKKGEYDWNGAAHFAGVIDWPGEGERTYELYLTQNQAYWQIAYATETFMAGLSCDGENVCTMSSDGFEGGYINAASTDYLTQFNGAVAWGGFSTPFDLQFALQTCARPENAPDTSVCGGGGGGNGGNGGNGGGGGQSNYETNPSIYNEDGSVQAAGNIGELFTMFAACESFDQVVAVLFANFWVLFSWF